MTEAVIVPTALQIHEALNAVAAAFETAARASVTVSTYTIANLVVRVEYAGEIGTCLAPGLRHLEAPLLPPDLTIRAFDSASTGAMSPLDEAALRALIPAGLPGVNVDRHIHVAYRRPDSGLSLLDTGCNAAVYWVPAAAHIPPWERAAPFRGIFSHWMAIRCRRFVHGAAVGTAGSAVLLVGRGGSGKSTTALTCLAAGMDYGGDDYCLVDVAALQVFPLYRSAKLHPENVKRVPWLLGEAVNEGDAREKLVYFPSPRGGGAIPASMRIAAIVLPHVTGAASPRLRRTTAAAALAAIAPTTLLQLTYGDSSALHDFAALAKSVPAYSLELGGQMDAVPSLLRSILGT